MAWRGYVGVADTLGPFDVQALDRFEGVLSGDLCDLRRYAGGQEMLAIVQRCSMELLVVEGADAPGVAIRSEVYPSGGNIDAAVPKLRDGVLDMVFVRYESGDWQHYQSVCFPDARPWRVGADLRGRVEALVAACHICGALFRGERDTARTLMFALLEPLVVVLL